MRSPVLLLFLTACSSVANTTHGPTSAADASTGDANVLAGTFLAQLNEDGSTSLVGKIYDGASLSEVIDVPQITEGDCVLTTPRVPFCSTSCGGSAACVEDETCKAYPLAHGAGVVTVTGISTATGASTFTMSPVVNTYQSTTTLAYPGFTEGGTLSIAAAGDYYAAFSITTKGVAPLVTPSTGITLTRDSAATLTWTAASDPAASTMTVKLDISHHGGTKGKVTCKTADNGSLTLSSTMVNKLLDLGVAGYPTVVLTRASTGSTVIAPGRVELVASAVAERPVSVAGLTSCTDSAECPSGTTCQADLTCK